jgi:hypothetical protein
MEVNFDEISKSLGISREIYLRILNKAINQTSGDFHAMDKAWEIDDINTIQSISHRWKGDFSNLRLTDIALNAKEMNDLAKIGENMEGIKLLYGRFKGLFEQLRKIYEDAVKPS